jgi:hypothetical protein
VNEETIIRALNELVERFDGEAGDWNDVLERAGLASRREIRVRGRRRRAGLLLLAATAVAAVALAVVSPWQGGASVVDRAAAAILAAPSSGQVLYERITLRHVWGSPPPGRRLKVPVFSVPVDVWMDGRAHVFRATFGASPPLTSAVEVGGRIGSSNGLTHTGSANELSAAAFPAPVTQAVLDPAAFVKAALTSGRAEADGKATIGGREVLRIRIASPDAGTSKPLALLFVDEHTYRPVRVEIDAGAPVPEHAGLPLTCITQLFPFACEVAQPGDTWVYDFREYRYLPATAASRRLADIRAMHPGAPIL